jgi:flavin reductase (DIM6/NTAB) family NADH-FMN oxidoreductase RutF
VAGDDLRALLREVPAPVGVVTVRLGDEAAGLTVDSFVSLSLEPPLVGIALRRHAALHELLREAGAFAVSLLASGQEHLAQHFARGVPPIAHWTGIETAQGELGSPLLAGALGWIECRLASEYELGDHTLFVGEVASARRGPGREGLVHLRQAYT